MAQAESSLLPSFLAPRARPSTSSTRGPLLVVAGACAWGSWSLFFRPAEAVAPIAPALEAAVVFATMLAIALPFALRGGALPRPPSTWSMLAALGVSEAMSFLCFFWAMQRTTVAVAALTHYVAPIVVAVAAPLVFGERPSPRARLALPLAAVGLVLLLGPERASPSIEGPMLGLFSAVFFATNLLLSKALSSRCSPAQVVALPKPFALIALAPFVVAAAPAPPPVHAVLLLVAGGALAGCAGCALFYAGLRTTPASRASLLCLCEPVVAAALGAAVFGEALGPLAALGGALVVLAAALPFTRARARS